MQTVKLYALKNALRVYPWLVYQERIKSPTPSISNSQKKQCSVAFNTLM